MNGKDHKQYKLRVIDSKNNNKINLINKLVGKRPLNKYHTEI